MCYLKYLMPKSYSEFAKYDSKLDFDCKSIPKLESNAKVTQKPCEITIIPL